MDQQKKEGVSVKEIQNFTKKNRFKVFFCLAFVLACLFSFVFFHWFSPVAMSVGAVIGLLVPTKMESWSHSIFSYVMKQEQMTKLVLGGVLLVVSIFLPFVIFLMIGLHGGKDISKHASNIDHQGPTA